MSDGYYAFTRKLDPARGVPVVDSGSWTAGSPMAEVIVRVLRTPKGSYRADPSFGVEYKDIDKGAPDAPTRLQLAIETALAVYVRDKLITDLRVKVQRAGSQLRYEVSFTDPRIAATQRPVRGAL